MPPNTPAKSAALHHQVRRAERLSHCFTRFLERLDPDDAGFVWAVTRAEQLRHVVATVVGEHEEGRLDERLAVAQLGSYVQVLEESLLAYVRSTRRASSPAAA
jgi:hypothetical protein